MKSKILEKNQEESVDKGSKDVEGYFQKKESYLNENFQDIEERDADYLENKFEGEEKITEEKQLTNGEKIGIGKKKSNVKDLTLEKKASKVNIPNDEDTGEKLKKKLSTEDVKTNTNNKEHTRQEQRKSIKSEIAIEHQHQQPQNEKNKIETEPKEEGVEANLDENENLEDNGEDVYNRKNTD